MKKLDEEQLIIWQKRKYQLEIWKNTKTIPGIAKSPRPISDRKAKIMMEKKETRMFSPHVMAGGRFNNCPIPFEEGIY